MSGRSLVAIEKTIIIIISINLATMFLCFSVLIYHNMSRHIFWQLVVHLQSIISHHNIIHIHAVLSLPKLYLTWFIHVRNNTVDPTDIE